MKKKIVSIFCCTLMLSTLFTIANARNIDEENESLIRGIQKINEDKVINSTILDIQYKNKVFCNSRDEFIDQQQTQHDPAGWNINYDQFVAQSFKPSVPRISKVDLKLFKYGGIPDYDLEFSIREQLSGSDIVKVTKAPSEVIDGWNEFEFTDFEVEVDRTYYLVCEGDAGLGGDPIYCWYCRVEGNPYARGMTHIFNYDVWHQVPASDCCFRTYYTNSAPNKPSISGPTSGNYGKPLDYKFMASDPDADSIFYYIDWGDGFIENWIGPYESGYEITRTHTWEEQGDYIIRAKVKDTFDMESDWAEFPISIPRNRVAFNLLFQRCIDRFPIIEKIFHFIFKF
ncbi:MAG: hypothetical protein KAW45_02145 [Thermoplasmatales archaeon]|nr:hypothetical protein [Thermoplasmatales archaeon]